MLLPLIFRYSQRFILLILALLLCAGGASAHPMGNFSINHYARFEARRDHLRLLYVLDLAEIPTVTEKEAMRPDTAGTIRASDRDAYLRARTSEWAANLRLTLNGDPVALRAVPLDLQLRPGAGGLDILRLRFTAEIPLAFGSGLRAIQVDYQDTNYPQRIGWKEIVVHVAPGIRMTDSTAAAQDLSHELAAYPLDAGITPPQQTLARFTLLPAGSAAASSVDTVPMATSATASRPATPQDAFTQAIATRRLTPAILLLGLGIAFIFGAFHALSPGHGKAMVAAYLVGARGTARHAVLLGLTVTITHVLGVYALGLVTLFASQYVVPEKLYTILSVVSGLAICGVGASLFIGRLRDLSTEYHHSHDHDHEHEHDLAEAHDHHASDHWHDENGQVHYHTHEHPHIHEHDLSEQHTQNPKSKIQNPKSHGHSHAHGIGHHHHLPEGPITLRGLIALGISGGLVPCPSALVVLLSAIALHRLTYGLMLITAFSLGLASVLVGIGLMVVSTRQWVTRIPMGGALLRRLPVASAAVITLVGVALIVRALGQGMP